MELKNENYTTIHGWMINELNLKGNELIIYAVIYGFSQIENQTFHSTLQYLADWTNSSKQSVINCLKSLIDKGLIKKIEREYNGMKYNEYYSTKFNTSQQSLMGGQQSLIPIQESLPNNNIYINSNIKDNKENYTNNSIVKEKRFVKPTLEDVIAYCEEKRNGVDPEKWYNYYESNGWKVGKNSMKKWKACVNTWARQNFGNNNATSNETTDKGFKKYSEDEIVGLI